MRQIRTVNRSQFIDWLSLQKDKLPRKALADQAGLSASLINQMLCGKLPGELSRRKISNAIGMPEDELFPIVEESKKFVR